MPLTKRQYLSPSAVSLWFKNRDEFVLKYLATKRPPRMPQTAPMSVGSAFDAFVKNYIYEELNGPGSAEGTEYEIQLIFNKQVEEQNRSFAYTAGKDCFQQYEACGALSGLMSKLRKASNVQMEFTARGQVDASSGGVYAPVTYGAKDNPVVILGIPDLCWLSPGGVQPIFDWKVNGYCAKTGASPVAGYVNILGGKKTGAHKDCDLTFHKDIEINGTPNLQEKQPDWATQLCCYGWLTGIPVGETMIVCVDQLCCKPGEIRVAQHRCEITRDYQLETLERFQKCWDAIESGWIFDKLTRSESDARCEMLTQQGLAYTDDEKGDWLASITRKY